MDTLTIERGGWWFQVGARWRAWRRERTVRYLAGRIMYARRMRGVARRLLAVELMEIDRASERMRRDEDEARQRSRIAYRQTAAGCDALIGEALRAASERGLLRQVQDESGDPKCLLT